MIAPPLVPDLNLAGPVADNDYITNINEQTVFNHTRDLVQRDGQVLWVADTFEVQIKNEITLIGHIGRITLHPLCHVTAQHIGTDQNILDQGAGGVHTEGQHLYRQRKGTERRNLF